MGRRKKFISCREETKTIFSLQEMKEMDEWATNEEVKKFVKEQCEEAARMGIIVKPKVKTKISPLFFLACNKVVSWKKDSSLKHL